MFNSRKIISFLILSIFLIASPVFAMVGFDNKTNTTFNDVASVTFASHSVTTSANNLLMMVGVSWVSTVGNSTTITGITYNGVAMTKLTRKDTTVNAWTSEVWYLYAPATGANNVVVTWDDAGGTKDVTGVVGEAVFYNVNQTTGVGTAVTATGAASPLTVNVTGTSVNSMVFDNAVAEKGSSANALAIGANQISNWNTNSTKANQNVNGASSVEPNTGGTVTMSWTETVAKAWAIIGVEIKSDSSSVLFDVAGNSTGDVAAGGSVSVTVSATLGTLGSNLILLGFSNQDDGTGVSGTSIISVQMDGVNMTQIDSTIPNSGFDDMYYILTSGAGNHTITITTDGTPPADGGRLIAMGVASYQNVSSTSPIGTPVHATGTTTPITANITGTNSSNMIVDAAHTGGGTVVLTKGNFQASDWNNSSGSGTLRQTSAGSHKSSLNGSATMSYTENTNRAWAIILVEIKVGSATTVPKRSLMGVGI